MYMFTYLFMHLSMYFSFFVFVGLELELLASKWATVLVFVSGIPQLFARIWLSAQSPIRCPDVLGKQERALECLDELSAAPLRCTDPAVASGLGRPCHRASKARTWGTCRAALLRSGPAPVSEVSVAGLHSSDQVPHLLLQPLWLWGNVIQEAMRASSQAPLCCQPGNHWWITCGPKSQRWLYVCVVSYLVLFIVSYLYYI
jgi:hypothetical protein